VGSPRPLVAALRHLTSDSDASLDLLKSLADQLPQASQRLAVWAAELTRRLISDAHRRLATNDPAFRLALAESLSNLAAIREAVDIRRELAGTRPDVFRPALAASLTNLALRLAGLERWEDALTATSEAVDIYQELPARWPDVYQDELQGSLDLLDQFEQR
jgi:tetratricopeptide (TPR) repeat protein